MPNCYRHILWDWNGTLFDDAWLCVEIINVILARRGMRTVNDVEYATHFTFPVRDYYAHVGFDFTKTPFETLAAEFVEIYDRRRFECALQPEATRVLTALGARGLTQSVLSAYEQSRLEEMIGFFTLRDYFTHLAGLNDYYSASKVELGKRFLAELDAEPGEVVLIGDSLHDAEVAAEMGIACALIPSGHFSRERLLIPSAMVLTRLPDVLEWV